MLQPQKDPNRSLDHINGNIIFILWLSMTFSIKTLWICVDDKHFLFQIITRCRANRLSLTIFVVIDEKTRARQNEIWREIKFVKSSKSC